MLTAQKAPSGTKRAAIYVRVSSKRQEDEGQSLETQEDACRAHCAQQGFDVLGVWSDVRSGNDLFGRPGLTEIREQIRLGNASIIVAHSLDRLTRNQAHLGVILSECDHHDADVELVTESLEDTPEGRLLQSVRGFVAEIERTKILERTLRGRRARAERKGMLIPGKRALYGYRWRDATKGALDLDPDTAPIARRIFEMHLTGESLRSICKSLTAEHIPTPSGGEVWQPSTLYNLLHNSLYTGHATAMRVEHTRARNGKITRTPRPLEEHIVLPVGTVPPIVTQEEFAAVEVRLQANKREAIRNNHDPESTLLRSGIIRCGTCGTAMAAVTSARKRRAYRCNTRSRDRYGCRAIQIDAEQIDGIVWDHVREIVLDPDVINERLAHHQRGNSMKSDFAAIDQRITSVEKQRQRISRAIGLLDDEDAAAPLFDQLRGLSIESKRLLLEREDLLRRESAREADSQMWRQLAEWCDLVRDNVNLLTYSERRNLLLSLGTKVQVWSTKHTPRFEITMDLGDIVFSPARMTGSIFITSAASSGPASLTSRAGIATGLTPWSQASPGS